MRKEVIVVAVIAVIVLPAAGYYEVNYGRGSVERPVVAYGETTWRTELPTAVKLFKGVGIDPTGFRRTVVTAEETNRVAAEITGRRYTPSQIYSCAAVTPYNEPPRSYREVEGYRIYVGPEITVCKPETYAEALASIGAPPCCVTIRSPVRATGEAALAGVYKAMREAGVKVTDRDARFSQAVLEAVKGAGNDPRRRAAAVAVVAVCVFRGADDPQKAREVQKEIENVYGVNLPPETAVHAAQAARLAEEGAEYSWWWLFERLLEYWV
ncbi:DUF1002 domain-containing protein [Methanopyrus sp.]